MPTIGQLPAANTVSSYDELPISQHGTVRVVSVGDLLATTQPAIILSSSSLLGRASLGPGSPEEVEVGLGLSLESGTVVANGADHASYPSTLGLLTAADLVISNQGTPMLMPTGVLKGLYSAGSNITIDPDGVISANAVGTSMVGGLSGSSIGVLQVVSSVNSPDIVPISQSGTDRGVTYANFLNGLTIDQAPDAGPAANSDTIWVGQGTNALYRQSFAAIWAWISSQMTGYRIPFVEITSNITLDVADHSGHILLCSQPVTVASAAGLASGFQCQIINLSSGMVSFASNFVTSSGLSTLASQQTATIRCLTYSAGTVVYASIEGA